MRRGALVLLLALTVPGAAAAAPATCADEVRDAAARLPEVKDPAHRQELQLLLDKAGMDAAAGREQLCLDAMVRAQLLLPVAVHP